MVADVRFNVTQPLRATLSVALYPVQWLAMRPQAWAQYSGEYLQSLQEAQADTKDVRQKLLQQAQRAAQVEQLALENQQLRALLNLQERLNTSGFVAEVLYDAADPYTRKLIINKGMTNGVKQSAPVMDEHGILGQVTRVLPLVSEVTLVTDREHSIPVLNTRTGARGGRELRACVQHARHRTLRFAVRTGRGRAGPGREADGHGIREPRHVLRWRGRCVEPAAGVGPGEPADLGQPRGVPDARAHRVERGTVRAGRDRHDGPGRGREDPRQQR